MAIRNNGRSPALSYPKLRIIDAWCRAQTKKNRFDPPASVIAKLVGVSARTVHTAKKRQGAYKVCL